MMCYGVLTTKIQNLSQKKGKITIFGCYISLYIAKFKSKLETSFFLKKLIEKKVKIGM